MYCVSIGFLKHKWKFWRMRNAVGTQPTGECFHSFFKFSKTSTSVSKMDRNTEKVFSIYFQKFCNKKGKQFVYFGHQINVKSL